MKRLKSIALLPLVVLLVFSGPLRSADMLRWDAQKNRVDADIESWTVPQLLERIARVTGWQVYMDPSISNTVPTKFRDKPSGEALRRLLGPINYALAPDTNGSRLFVFRNDRAEATKLVAAKVDEKAKSRIENELIVTLKPGEKIEDIAKKLGAKIVGRMDDKNTYKLRFDDAKATETARDTLRNDPAVAGVEDNYSVPRPELPEMLAGAARPLGLKADAVPDSKYVIVALLDTAVQGKEAGISDFLLPEINVADPCDTPPTSLTHGTSMAQTVLRSVAAAKGGGAGTSIRILPINIYGCGESTSTFDVAKGMYEAAKAGAAIINASLGSEGNSPFLENTANNTAAGGVRIFAAAGNTHSTEPVYPAAYQSVTSVTAGTADGKIAPWANYGPDVDMIAPGSSPVNFKGQGYVVTGTSTSTAIASGASAAQLEQSRANGTATKKP